MKEKIYTTTEVIGILANLVNGIGLCTKGDIMPKRYKQKVTIDGQDHWVTGYTLKDLQVLIMAGKYPMNIRRSFEDHNLSDIYAKYFSSEDPKNILEKRRKLVEERERIRKERKEKISNMLDSGCTMEYIAEELMLPESTVRHLANHLNDDK